MRSFKLVALGVLVVVVSFFSGCTGNAEPAKKAETAKPSISEEELGLRKETLYSEKSIRTAGVEYGKAAPGASQKFDRAFENAPPMISHDIEGMEPITKENNMCVSCHMPEMAKAVNATAVPKTHLMDLRSGKDNKGELESARWNCVQCHTPQANLPLAVSNKFKADFKNKDGAAKSNLIDTINEGVR